MENLKERLVHVLNNYHEKYSQKPKIIILSENYFEIFYQDFISRTFQGNKIEEEVKFFIYKNFNLCGLPVYSTKREDIIEVY